jgi:hypothetical protein
MRLPAGHRCGRLSYAFDLERQAVLLLGGASAAIAR